MLTKEELDKAFDERFPAVVKTKLQQARVAIAGLGGLGSNIGVMLARSGVGHLLLVDFDIVDTTNLNRQMYCIKHLGKPKTEAMLELLQDINPYLDIETKCIKVTKDNIIQLFQDYPIVCEAFDQPEQKAMLVTGLLQGCPQTKIVAGSGMAGYGNANDIKTVQAMSRLYICGDQTTDISPSTGLMAPRVAICAGHQANKVLQLILDN